MVSWRPHLVRAPVSARPGGARPAGQTGERARPLGPVVLRVCPCGRAFVHVVRVSGSAAPASVCRVAFGSSGAPCTRQLDLVRQGWCGHRAQDLRGVCRLRAAVQPCVLCLSRHFSCCERTAHGVRLLPAPGHDAAGRLSTCRRRTLHEHSSTGAGHGEPTPPSTMVLSWPRDQRATCGSDSLLAGTTQRRRRRLTTPPCPLTPPALHRGRRRAFCRSQTQRRSGSLCSICWPRSTPKRRYEPPPATPRWRVLAEPDPPLVSPSLPRAAAATTGSPPLPRPCFPLTALLFACHAGPPTSRGVPHVHRRAARLWPRPYALHSDRDCGPRPRRRTTGTTAAAHAALLQSMVAPRRPVVCCWPWC